MNIFALLFLLPFYLLGCFPTGLLIARHAGVDIQNSGSGNVGATNVARTVGKKAGIITLLLDVVKGALAPLLASLFTSDPRFIAAAGAAVVFGHCFSIPGKLKGGKGVAAALGVTFAFSPWCALASAALFASSFMLSRTVSIASLTAALGTPVVALLVPLGDSYSMALGVVALLIVYRHKENIQRIAEGREPKFGSR